MKRIEVAIFFLLAALVAVFIYFRSAVRPAGIMAGAAVLISLAGVGSPRWGRRGAMLLALAALVHLATFPGGAGPLEGVMFGAGVLLVYELQPPLLKTGPYRVERRGLLVRLAYILGVLVLGTSLASGLYLLGVFIQPVLLGFGLGTPLYIIGVLGLAAGLAFLVRRLARGEGS